MTEDNNAPQGNVSPGKQASVLSKADQIEGWKNTVPDGEVFEVQAGNDTYYFRKPSRPEFKLYADGLLKSSYDAVARLLMACLLWPAVAEFQARVEKQPGLVPMLANNLGDVFGTNLEMSVKKL
jgi:hypothetical protein